MKPVIGLTPSIDHEEEHFMLHVAHVRAIEAAGAIPLLLPYTKDEALILQMADRIDGLYLTGGHDIDPHFFNEEPHASLGRIHPLRDQFEIELVHRMIEKNKPILGVCRGSQVINVALGGSMYQDLAAQKDSNLIQHKQKRPLRYHSHFVYVEKNSLLYEITKEEKLKVNSNHHQANRILGDELIASAASGDGVIEAIERTIGPFVLGVQWHPEQMLKEGDEPSRKIYEWFVKEALNASTA